MLALAEGRPRKLTAVSERRIVHYVTTEEAKSASMAARLLKRDTSIEISAWTARRILKQYNFKLTEKKMKPMLYKKNY